MHQLNINIVAAVIHAYLHKVVSPAALCIIINVEVCFVFKLHVFKMNSLQFAVRQAAARAEKH